MRQKSGTRRSIERGLAFGARPLGPVFGIEEITAKASAELFGVRALCETEDRHVDVVLTVQVAARAERQTLRFAEELDREVPVPYAAIRGQRHLMWPEGRKIVIWQAFH